MRALHDLRPEFYRSEQTPHKGYLTFDCPLCVTNQDHRLTIPTSDAGPAAGINGALRWGMSGTPPHWDSISLSPSIDLKERCFWHGFVTNGEVV